MLKKPASLASAGAVQWLEERGGVIFVEGVQRVLGIELVEGIVGVAHFVSWPYFCLAINLYLIPSYAARGRIFFRSNRP